MYFVTSPYDTGGMNGCFRQELVETQNATCPLVDAVVTSYGTGAGDTSSTEK